MCLTIAHFCVDCQLETKKLYKIFVEFTTGYITSINGEFCEDCTNTNFGDLIADKCIARKIKIR